MIQKAIHLPGGNYYDDIRIDLGASYEAQDLWLNSVQKEPQKSRSRSKSMIERRKLNLFQKYNLHEALVNSGIIRDWFVEFADYWTNCLSGRKITIQDFHWLHGNYRARRQITEKLEWASETQHVENWQDYRNIADVFNHVYKYSLMPIREARFDVMLPRQHCCVLEYGCGMAPMYRTYKKYFYYLQAKWQLADIQSFNFHFTRHAYAKDIDLDRGCVFKFL